MPFLLSLLSTSILSSMTPVLIESFASGMWYAERELGGGVREGTLFHLLTLACLHLVHGALVQWVGDRNVAYEGLLLLMVFTYPILLQAVPPGLEQTKSTLLVERAGQAFACSACTVASLSRLKGFPLESVSFVNVSRSVLLVLSPLVGQLFLTAGVGWRFTFSFPFLLAGLGVVCLCAEDVREEGTQPLRREEGGDRVEVTLLLSWSMAESLGFASLFCWVGLGSFSGSLGSIPLFGVWYGLTFVGSAVGSFLSPRLRCELTPPTLYLLSSSLSSLSLLPLLLLPPSSLGRADPFVCMGLFNLGRGLSSPLAQKEVMRLAPASRKGIVSGCFHSLRMLVAASLFSIGLFFPIWTPMLISTLLSSLIPVIAFSWINVKENVREGGDSLEMQTAESLP